MKLSRLSWIVWSMWVKTRSFTAPCFSLTCSVYCTSPLSHPAFVFLCFVPLCVAVVHKQGVTASVVTDCLHFSQFSLVPLSYQWWRTYSRSASCHMGVTAWLVPLAKCEVGATDEGHCCHGWLILWTHQSCSCPITYLGTVCTARKKSHGWLLICFESDVICGECCCSLLSYLFRLHHLPGCPLALCICRRKRSSQCKTKDVSHRWGPFLGRTGPPDARPNSVCA